jgi:hypothetical protein
MRYRQRVTRIEEYQRKQPPLSHFRMSVRVPWKLPPSMDQATWLREEVPCTYGEQKCPEMRIGLMLPEKAPSIQAWTERVQTYCARRSGSQA